MFKKEKIIGIVGGMGPRAGLALHELILKNSVVNKDQDHFSVAHISFSAMINDRTEFIEGKKLENPAEKIVDIIQLLNQAGADHIGIPCNTTHVPIIFNSILELLKNRGINVDLKNMVHETVKYARQFHSHSKKITVMSTNGTYRSNLYNDFLERCGFEVFVPEFDFQNNIIHRMIYDPVFGIKSSFYIKENVFGLLEKAFRHFEQNKVELVILGCTEFSLIPEEKLQTIPIIDSLDVLAKTLVNDVRP